MDKVERVWEHSLKNPEGFTISLESWNTPKRGFCVAYLETQNCHGKDGLTKAIRHAEQHCNIVGGWLEETSGKYYFDSVLIVDTKEEAERLAKENEQYAYFDLVEKKSVFVTE